ncbi:MAG: hypothetical protein WA063_01350 [Minisyncoccia bacterium]
MKVKQTISLLLLAVAMFGIIGATAVSAGASSQKVEHGYGNYERVYPILTVPSYQGECGSDTTDIVLQYNTYLGPRVNPDNVRWNSGLWWVNLYLDQAYPGGLSANGLGSTTTRVCLGKAGQYLSKDDLRLVYLWHK